MDACIDAMHHTIRKVSGTDFVRYYSGGPGRTLRYQLCLFSDSFPMPDLLAGLGEHPAISYV